eukprot:Selendium_serpulae@DN420_c0_g1_i1.p1
MEDLFEKDSNVTDFWFSPDAMCSSSLCSGLFYMRNTASSRETFTKALDLVRTKFRDHNLSDQAALIHAIKRTRTPFRLLPCDAFQNGPTFLGEFYERQPIAIHANYFIESDKRQGCLEATGLWMGNKKPLRISAETKALLECPRNVSENRMIWAHDLHVK